MLECVAGIPGAWEAQATVDLYRELLTLTPVVTKPGPPDSFHRLKFENSRTRGGPSGSSFQSIGASGERN